MDYPGTPVTDKSEEFPGTPVVEDEAFPGTPVAEQDDFPGTPVEESTVPTSHALTLQRQSQRTAPLTQRLTQKQDLIGKLDYLQKQTPTDVPDETGFSLAQRRAMVESGRFNALDDATVAPLAQDIETRYRTASKAQGLGAAAVGALKRGYESTGAMLTAGGRMLKPGALTPEDKALVEAGALASGEYATATPRAVGGVQDIRGIGDAAKFATESILENVPRALPMLAGAAVGGIVGGPIGVKLGAGVAGLAQNVGEAAFDQAQEGRIDKPYALAQGAGYSLVDALIGGERGVVSRMLRKPATEAASAVLKRDFVSSLGKAVKSAAKIGAWEAVSEPLQSQVVGRGVRAAQTGSVLASNETPQDAAMAAVNEAVGGFLAGFGLGGAESVKAYRTNQNFMRRADEVVGKLAQDADVARIAGADKLLVKDYMLGMAAHADENDPTVRQRIADRMAEAYDSMDASAKQVVDAYRSTFTETSVANVPQDVKPTWGSDPLAVQKGMAEDADGGVSYTDKKSGITISEDGGAYTVSNPVGVKMPLDKTTYANLTDAVQFASDLSRLNAFRKTNNDAKAKFVTSVAKRQFPNATVVMVDSPDQITDTAVRSRFVGNEQAFYNPTDNSVYVMLDTIDNPAQAVLTLRHENFHNEFKSYVEKRAKQRMATDDKLSIAQARRAEVASIFGIDNVLTDISERTKSLRERVAVETDAKQKERLQQRLNKMQRRMNAVFGQKSEDYEELLAEAYETRFTEPTKWQKRKDAIAQWLRETTGVQATPTDADMRKFMAEVAEHGKKMAEGTAPRYDRQTVAERVKPVAVEQAEQAQAFDAATKQAAAPANVPVPVQAAPVAAPVAEEVTERAQPISAVPSVQPDSGAVAVPEAAAVPASKLQRTTRDALGKVLRDAVQRDVLEAEGRDILASIEESGRTANDVINEFSDTVFPSMSPDAQRMVAKKLQAYTRGLKLGGNVEWTKRESDGTITKGASPLNAWRDVFQNADIGGDIASLEGTDRGAIAIMERVNREYRKTSTPQPPQAEGNRGVTETTAPAVQSTADTVQSAPVAPQVDTSRPVAEQGVPAATAPSATIAPAATAQQPEVGLQREVDSAVEDAGKAYYQTAIKHVEGLTELFRLANEANQKRVETSGIDLDAPPLTKKDVVVGETVYDGRGRKWTVSKNKKMVPSFSQVGAQGVQGEIVEGREYPITTYRKVDWGFSTDDVATWRRPSQREVAAPPVGETPEQRSRRLTFEARKRRLAQEENRDAMRNKPDYAKAFGDLELSSKRFSAMLDEAEDLLQNPLDPVWKQIDPIVRAKMSVNRGETLNAEELRLAKEYDFTPPYTSATPSRKRKFGERPLKMETIRAGGAAIRARMTPEQLAVDDKRGEAIKEVLRRNGSVEEIAAAYDSVKSAQPAVPAHQQTQAEYVANGGTAKTHKSEVGRAIQRGETVPDAVMAAYPDVAAKVAASAEKRDATTPPSSDLAAVAEREERIAKAAKQRDVRKREKAMRKSLADGQPVEIGDALVVPPRFRRTAYHGSPHIFDKFDLSRIGTGEGAQAYGYGLYYAESPKVAEGYRVAGNQRQNSPMSIALSMTKNQSREAAATALRNRLPSLEKDFDAEYVDVRRKALDILESEQPITDKGNVYTVELDVDDADLLDWDAPLSQQSERVRTALFMSLRDKLQNMASNRETYPSDLTGQDVYEMLSLTPQLKKDQKAASAYLDSLGIKGIRYLDAQSRTSGDGTRNYVIFDDALIRITKRNEAEAKGYDERGAARFRRNVSPAQDAEYMAAVERGDVAAAQAMVDDAARAAGYDYDTFKGYYPKDWKTGEPITVIARPSELPAFNHGEQGVNVTGFFSSDKDVADRFAKGISKEGVTDNFYLRFENPYVIDAKGEFAGKIEFGMTGIPFRNAVRSGKYDGVIIRNTKDEGDVFVTLKTNQAKLSDPITRDDSGRVIPLSARFNDATPDIRFRRNANPQTATPEFRKWFGDSKVVDADGEPMVVYHGTASDFGVFRTSRSGELGSGIYFSDNPKEASGYVNTNARGGDGQNVMPVYLSIKNPLVISSADQLWSEVGNVPDDKVIDALSAKGYDGVMFKRPLQKWVDGKGVVDLGEMQTHIVAFSPTQIKSATGNVGSFDASNPDIRFRRRERTRALPSTDAEARLSDRYVQVPKAQDAASRKAQLIRNAVYADGLDREGRDTLRNQAEAELSKGKADMALDAARGVYNSDRSIDTARMVTAMNATMLDAVKPGATDETIDLADEVNYQGQKKFTNLGRSLAFLRDKYNTPEGRRAELAKWALMPDDVTAAKLKQDMTWQERKEIRKASIAKAKQRMAELRKTTVVDDKGNKVAVDVYALTSDQLMNDKLFKQLVAKIAQKRATMGEKLYEFWQSSILSSPVTLLVVNPVGNVANIALEIGPQRQAEIIIGKVLRSKDAPTESSTAAGFKYANAAMPDAWKNAKKTFTTEQAQLGEYADKWDTSGQAIGKTLFGVNMGFDFGKAVRSPRNFLSATDQGFRTWLMNFHVADLATRKFDQLLKDPTSELTESDRDDYIKAAMKDDTDFYQQAQKITDRQLFQTKPGIIGQLFLGSRRSENPIARWLSKYLIPFVTTPANVIKTGARKSPLGTIPLVWNYASGKYSGSESAKAEGVRLAAEQAVGWAVMGAIGLLMQGDDDDPLGRPRITGTQQATGRFRPGEREFEKRNEPAMSVRIGDSWYSYRRIEPIATILSTVVDIMEAAQHVKSGDLSKAGERMAKNLVGMFSDRTYIKTVGDIIDAVRDNDPGSYMQIATGTLGGFVPNIAKTTMRGFDPVMRDIRNRSPKGTLAYYETALKRFGQSAIPAAPFQPVARYDVAGRPITKEGEGGAGVVERIFSPFQRQSATRLTKVDAMLKRYAERTGESNVLPAPPQVPDISLFGRKDKIPLTDAEFAEYQRIAGETAARRLSSMSFNFANPTKRDVKRVERTYEDARKLAKRQISAVVRRRVAGERKT